MANTPNRHSFPFLQFHPPMRIPASKLVAALEINACLPLRTHDFQGANPAVPYLEIISLACQGLIEGIATKAGKVKLLRLLPETEREDPKPASADDIDNGRSTAFASTNMGVYREALREAIIVEDVFGRRTVRAEGDIIGYDYTHHAQPERRWHRTSAM